MIEKYNHHGTDVFVDSRLKGKLRDHCLCFKCKRFGHQPGLPQNCQIAQATYENCVKFHTATPMYECPEFDEKSLEDQIGEVQERVHISSLNPLFKDEFKRNIQELMKLRRQQTRRGKKFLKQNREEE
jgi:hypothetical protein